MSESLTSLQAAIQGLSETLILNESLTASYEAQIELIALWTDSESLATNFAGTSNLLETVTTAESLDARVQLLLGLSVYLSLRAKVDGYVLYRTAEGHELPLSAGTTPIESVGKPLVPPIANTPFKTLAVGQRKKSISATTSPLTPPTKISPFKKLKSGK